MRLRMIGVIGASALAISSCGSASGTSPTKPRPPTPVNLTVYVNNSRVAVSPMSAGAGPVVLTVTNQASQAEALAIAKSGQSHALASTAPINPQGTTQVSVNFQPGAYTIATAPQRATDASLSQPSSIRAAQVHIGRERPSSGGDLLQP